MLIVLIFLISIFAIDLVYIIFPVEVSQDFEKNIEQEKSKQDSKRLISEKELSKKSIETNGKTYLSKEDLEFEIPKIPDAPKKKEKITKETHGLSIDILNKMREMESKDTEVILVNCERCNNVIPVPVPRKAVLESELPVVPISYIHSQGNDKHCITLHLDHDFDVRRQRISDVVLSD
ncbi:MAG: hypothetical protein ACFFAS_18170 [Promethearchaeota archaeon]